MTRAADLVLDARLELGEGPVWNPADGRLWWVDIRGPALHAVDPTGARHRTWPMPAPIGCFAFLPPGRGGLLVALATGLARFEPETGAFEPLAALPGEPAGNRPNDGKVDRAGRFFWVGSMRDDAERPLGTLYRYGGGPAAPAAVRGPFRIPNALAFSPDGRVMTFADSADGRILAFAYDPETGGIGGERTLAAADVAPGVPDGATFDAEGFLWNARYGGGRLVRLTPDGRLDRTVDLPVSQPTSCAFGGPDMGTLFVTTAAQGLSPERRAAEPLAGGLFALRPGVGGLPEAPFAGA